MTKHQFYHYKTPIVASTRTAEAFEYKRSRVKKVKIVSQMASYSVLISFIHITLLRDATVE